MEPTAGTSRRDADFSAYVEMRWRTLVRATQLLGCTLAEAEDVVQTALLTCYRRWGRVARADDRDAYVHRIVLNTLRDQRRRRWWGERPTEQLPDAPVRDGTDEWAQRDAVEQALGSLSTAHREVVVLRFHLDLSTPQIAEVLGIAPGTVRSRLSRALDALARDEHLADPTDAGGAS